MDIKTFIKNVREKFSALSGREKSFTVMTVTFAVILIPYLMLYSPASTKVKNKQLELQNIKKDIDSFNLVIASQSAQQTETATEKIVLPEAENLSGMLAAISREANIARVDFISISPEGFTHKDQFIELRVKLELRVRFRELHDFLRSLEAKHRLFLVQDLKFETNNTVYPSGIALLKAVTYLRKK